jgi:hypothetical protein
LILGAKVMKKFLSYIESHATRNIVLLCLGTVLIIQIILLFAFFQVADFEETQIQLNIHDFNHSISMTMPEQSAPLIRSLNLLIAQQFGQRYVVCVHMLLSWLVIVAAIFLLKKIGGTNLSIVALTLFFLGYWGWWEMTFNLGRPVPFSLAILLFFIINLTNISFTVRQALLGLIAGLAWLTRKTGVVFIPMLIVVPMLSQLGDFKKVIRGMGISMLIFFIVTWSWQAQIISQTGSISLSANIGRSVGSIYNMVKGNNSLSADVYPLIDLDLIQPVLDSHFSDALYVASKLEVGRFIYRFIIQQPVEFLLLSIKKVVLFFLPIQVPLGSADYHVVQGAVELTNFTPHHMYRFPFVIFNVVPLIAFCLYIAYFFVNMGSGNGTERQIHFNKLLLVTSSIYLLIHLAAWVETRFIIPLHPLWFVAAGFQAGEMLKRHISDEK